MFQKPVIQIFEPRYLRVTESADPKTVDERMEDPNAHMCMQHLFQRYTFLTKDMKLILQSSLIINKEKTDMI